MLHECPLEKTFCRVQVVMCRKRVPAEVGVYLSYPGR
jgi:hypothetical protein